MNEPVVLELSKPETETLVAFPEGQVADDLRIIDSELRWEAETPIRIILETGARARVALRYSARDCIRGEYRTRLHIELADQAHLELLTVSALPAPVLRVASDRVALGAGASLVWTDAGFDAGNGSYECDIDLNGRGAQLDFAGAYGASGTSFRQYTLNELHRGPGAKSRAVLKSALRNSARLIFRGLIHVEPGAPGTDAYLSNRNLILDDGARAESLPQLKIETDDVACSHGSTTGGPRDEELFYLMSRGLSRGAALSMLVLGHFGTVLDRAPGSFTNELETIASRGFLDIEGRE